MNTDIKKVLEIGNKTKINCDMCQEIIYITENQDNVCNDCNEDLKNISKKRIVN